MSETSLNWKNSLDLPYECDHIVDRALAGENAMVLMGCLMFLALSSGDAFALDLDDRFACALCLKGEKQPYPLLDNGESRLGEALAPRLPVAHIAFADLFRLEVAQHARNARNRAAHSATYSFVYRLNQIHLTTVQMVP
jgi:hypothetical protein